MDLFTKLATGDAKLPSTPEMREKELRHRLLIAEISKHGPDKEWAFKGTYFNKDVSIKCLHKKCSECLGTGVKSDGTSCVHGISCPCSSCTPYP